MSAPQKTTSASAEPETTSVTPENAKPIIKESELPVITGVPVEAAKSTDTVIISAEANSTQGSSSAAVASSVVLAATGEVKAEEDTSSGALVPFEAGFMSYKKASATFPIYHRRHFFFSDSPIPLRRLQPFYEKHKDKVDKDELNQLMAQAIFSGKGLLYYSKTLDSTISGIIDCARIVDISADESAADRFHIAYNSKQIFSFETGPATREAWLTSVENHKVASDAEIESIRSHEDYRKILIRLENRTCFGMQDDKEPTNDVFSDDDNAGAVAGATPEKPNEKLASSKRTSFLRIFKDKVPQDRNTTEASEVVEQQEDRILKKDKRKSFLAPFVSKKEAPPASDIVATEDVVAVDTEPAKDLPASDASPAKEKQDSFFAKIMKKKLDKNLPEQGNSAEIQEVIASIAADQVPTETSSSIAAITSDAVVVKSASEEESDTPEPITEKVGKHERAAETASKSGLARRFTSMFKSKRSEPSSEASVVSPELAETVAPQLPETAALQPESAEVPEVIEESQVTPSQADIVDKSPKSDVQQEGATLAA